jgi:hypothetical protein
MQFHYASCQGVGRANENKKEFKMVRCLGVPNVVSIPDGCILFCGGQVVFELAHTFWWVNRFVCHLYLIKFVLKFYMVQMLQSWNILGNNGI